MPVRRLFIEYDDPDESELLFTKRLADLRRRYPEWRVRAATTAGEPIPAPQPPSSAFNATRPPNAVHSFVDEQAAIHRSAAVRDDSGSELSDVSSTGNVAGECPRHAVSGMRVRAMAPPFGGKIGRVLRGRGESMLVEFGDDESWWYDREDLRVVARDYQFDEQELQGIQAALRDAEAALVKIGSQVPLSLRVALRTIQSLDEPALHTQPSGD
jgi:hypothetical protein